ncbi:hypothetical protein M885DRAFT_136026 [Pelagophyceae sp. CCMP2097]|nr:hypothetical protein M885DRAFT_136026 [Pelagophyceae sp. CCMP2097]
MPPIDGKGPTRILEESSRRTRGGPEAAMNRPIGARSHGPSVYRVKSSRWGWRQGGRRLPWKAGPCELPRTGLGKDPEEAPRTSHSPPRLCGLFGDSSLGPGRPLARFLARPMTVHCKASCGSLQGRSHGPLQGLSKRAPARAQEASGRPAPRTRFVNPSKRARARLLLRARARMGPLQPFWDWTKSDMGSHAGAQCQSRRKVGVWTTSRGPVRSSSWRSTPLRLRFGNSASAARTNRRGCLGQLVSQGPRLARNSSRRDLVTGTSSQGCCQGPCHGDLVTGALSQGPCHLVTGTCHGTSFLVAGPLSRGLLSRDVVTWTSSLGALVAGTVARGSCHRLSRELVIGTESQGPCHGTLPSGPYYGNLITGASSPPRPCRSDFVTGTFVSGIVSGSRHRDRVKGPCHGALP